MNGQQGSLFDENPQPWELDDAASGVVATVVFPAAPRGEFDYLVPGSLVELVKSGCRIKVPLGRGNRSAIGYCVAIQPQTITGRRLKEVSGVVDTVPLISASILKLTRWMADYYVCQWGPILEAVVPAGVRGQAGTRETVFLSVSDEVAPELAKAKLSSKQRAIVDFLRAADGPQTIQQTAQAAGCTTAPITTLRKKGLLQAETRRIYVASRGEQQVARADPWPLNTDQRAARDSIREHLDSREQRTLLLHGVTGSGKTEIYIRAIEEVTRFGRQAIVLVPEISLTPQTRERFQSRLDGVAVLHSHLSPSERHGEWQRIARGDVQVVVGARSAIFAPTPHLGLIVVDEEHEPSFKQETAPRYHARDVALQRAKMERIPLILGSATPALESWHRAKLGTYHLISMPNRVRDLPLPRVTTIDLRNENLRGGPRSAISRRLGDAVRRTLADNGQIILLLNRRGFSTHIQCPACGEVVRCDACDIALTHHKDGEKAICHYCDYRMDTPPRCPNCQFDGIRFGGLGTQRLESEVRARFKHATCLRMDSDTMRRPGSHEEALDSFRRGDVQILLGTQMIAKGLDFPGVTLVGVINADTGLHLPDFRAGERTFQLVTQVAGRTGRGDRGGEVLVQTFTPDHPAILAASRHDYVTFANTELPVREQFNYPPFAELVRVVVRGESAKLVEQFATLITARVRERLGSAAASLRILGPVPAPILKLRGKFRFHVMFQIGQNTAIRKVLHELSHENLPDKDIQWIVDVDPLSML